VRNLDGQIRVSSEPGTGTVFTLELPFEKTSSQDVMPRRLRNLFSTSLGSSKGPSPTSLPPKPHLNGATSKLEIMVPVGSPTSGSILENRRSIRIEGGSRDPSPSPKITISEPGSPMLDAEHDRSSFASMHVLVAEDNFVSQRVLAKRLTQLGYTVVVASNGQEAHDKFLTSSPKFDVILMDMKVHNHPACEA
jgi:hypothetical protein